ncbi:MAG: phospholipase D-like domain-containing protein [Steroidobacteraceae bacterium]
MASALAASLHALLTKPDPRSAVSWIALCCLFPLGGSILYWLFGINRVTTHAQPQDRGAAEAQAQIAPGTSALAQLIRTGDVLAGIERVAGNSLEALHNGEVAFPRMLRAIAEARHSVWLATYIFQTDPVGLEFVAALAAANARGVHVRVLVDGIGEWYDWPHVVPVLRRAGVTAARFLPPRLLPPSLALNCRNHRKLLVVDGSSAFTGGMNLGGREVGGSTGQRMSDIHFALQGPVVAQLGQTFAADWHFATAERLQVPQVTDVAGESVCRVVTGGPDESPDKLLLLILTAIATAQRQVQIMTPYFIPPPELIAELQGAALRGLEVSLLLPCRSNLRYVDWATMHWLPALIKHGVQVYMQQPPFSHAKLFIIDAQYAQIGSVNVDTRSLRLNFEIAVEVFCAAQCAQLASFVSELQQRAVRLTWAQVSRVPPLARVRNSLCWLISPYL